MRLFSLGFYVFLARQLKAEGLGQYAFALAYGTLWLAPSELGLNPVLSRELARDHGQLSTLAPTANTLKIYVLILLGVLALGAHLALGINKELTGVILALIAFAAATQWNEYLCSQYSGLERMAEEALLRTGVRGLSLLGAVLGYALEPTLFSMSIGLALGISLGGVVGALRLKTPWVWVLTPDKVSKLLQTSLPFLGASLLWNLYESQDVLILNWMGLPPRDVGHFSAAMKLLDMVKMAPTLLGGAALPLLAQTSLNLPLRFRRQAQRLTYGVWAGALLLAAGLAQMSPHIVKWVFGPDYAQTAHILNNLAWIIPLSFMNIVLVPLLVSLNQGRVMLWGAGFTTIVHAIGLFFMVKAWGLLGSVPAFALSEGLFLAINLFGLSRSVTWAGTLRWKSLWKPLAAGAAMVETQHILPAAGWLIPLGAGLSAFALVLTLSQGWPRWREPEDAL